MTAQETQIQQLWKIRRTALAFGVVQILLGISLTALSFTAFVFTSSDRIRNACPYWAGFTVFCSGGVGIIAWKSSSVMSMSIFTFFSAMCVVVQMIATILTGDTGGLLKSLVMCEKQISGETCSCCSSILMCSISADRFEFEGVDNCSILTGLLTGLMYGLCILTIFGSLLCFVATILGCTAVACETSRNQGHSSRRSHISSEDRYTWSSYPTDLSTLPSYAPPVYHSVENLQDYGLSSCIVPPPVYDPTDLPPPYCSQNPSLAESQGSLSSPEFSSCQVQYTADQKSSFVHTNSQNSVSQVQDLTKVHTTNRNTFTQGDETKFQYTVTQVQFPAGRDLSEPYMSMQSEIHDKQSTMQIDKAVSTSSTSSEVAHLGGRDPRSGEQSMRVTQSSGDFMPSGTSCLSCDSTNEASPDRELCYAENTDSHDNETVLSKGEVLVDPVIAQHPSIPLTRLQTEFCELVPDVSDSQRHNHPVYTVCSPLRGITVLSLRTHSSSLGENSVYVNSFEVMPRPPPNMQISLDEVGAPYSTDDLNTKNTKQHLTKLASRSNDALIEPRGCGRGERGKETTRCKRRKHLHDSTKHKDKRDACDKCKVNRGHEDSVTSGKETIV